MYKKTTFILSYCTLTTTSCASSTTITMLRNYDVALKKGDKGAQKYTKQDVIKSVTAQNKENAKLIAPKEMASKN